MLVRCCVVQWKRGQHSSLVAHDSQLQWLCKVKQQAWSGATAVGMARSQVPYTSRCGELSSGGSGVLGGVGSEGMGFYGRGVIRGGEFWGEFWGEGSSEKSEVLGRVGSGMLSGSDHLEGEGLDNLDSLQNWTLGAPWGAGEFLRT